MRKTFLLIPATLILSSMLVGASLAQTSVDFPFSTSTVLDTIDVELSSSGSNGSTRILGDGVTQQENTIANLGASCWIRAAHTLNWESAEGKPRQVTVTEADNLAAGWVTCSDGWVYYTQALGPGTLIPFAEDLFNPEGELWDGRQINVSSNIEVQAVQSDNFEPDFSSDTPWGDIEPQSCVHSRKEANVNE